MKDLDGQTSKFRVVIVSGTLLFARCVFAIVMVISFSVVLLRTRATFVFTRCRPCKRRM